MLIDGTGGPTRRAEVGVRGGRIAEVGDLAGADAAERLDAEGACLAPGFIDIHTHSDFSLPEYPRAENQLAQGVTTEVTGNCGLTPFPVAPERLDLLQRYVSFLGADLPWDWTTTADFLTMLEGLPLSHNVVPLVGHGTIRIAAMGFENRAATPAELESMRRLTAEAMEQGAFGLSSGLIYAPGTYSDTAELIELCRVVGRYGGFYATHLRSEADGLVEAVEEALLIGREAGVPVQLSHHKAMGVRNWGAVEKTLGMVDAARMAGQDVTLDQYPYTGSATTFTAFLPTWALAGGIDALLARLADPETRRRIATEMDATKPMPWEKVLFAVSENLANSVYLGKNLEAIGAARGQSAVDTALDLLESEGGNFGIIRFGMSEEDVRRVMRHPEVMVGSDGNAMSPVEGGRPHPRNYGTFARVLSHYVGEERVLPLEEAVRKMTSLPARRLGLTDRGLIRPGCAADLVLFRPEAVRDESSFDEPHRYATGMQRVWVNGHLVWKEGHDTGAVAGLVLRRQA